MTSCSSEGGRPSSGMDASFGQVERCKRLKGGEELKALAAQFLQIRKATYFEASERFGEERLHQGPCRVETTPYPGHHRLIHKSLREVSLCNPHSNSHNDLQLLTFLITSDVRLGGKVKPSR